jgi:hypothetical protein
VGPHYFVIAVCSCIICILVQGDKYHLIQALRLTDSQKEIPELLKRLATLRQQATNEEREQYR